MPIRRFAALAAAVALMAAPAFAQNTVSEAAKSDRANPETPPVAGANSFTESQARDRISKAGFSDLKELKKDDRGIWRGQAQKGGQPVNVALDFRGNVVQQ